MKRLMLFTLLLLGTTCFLSAQVEKKVQAKIDQVIVYPIGAQLEYIADFQAQAGPMTLVIPNLIPYIDQENIRVVSDHNFSIVNVQVSTDYLKENPKSDEIKQLRKQIEELTNKIEDEELMIKLNRDKIDFLNQNKQLSGKNDPISPENFKQMNQIYGSNLEALTLDIQKRDRTVKKYREELEKLHNQMATLTRTPSAPSGVLTLTIQAIANKSSKLSFSVYTSFASWYPSYDIKFVGFDKPLEITYYANIKQQTEVDWDQVSILLSTAQPQLSAQIPTLYPYFLSFIGYGSGGGAVSSMNRAAAVKGEKVTPTFDFIQEFTSDGDDEIAIIEEPVTSRFSQMEIVKEYKVAARQTIPSSPKPMLISYGETKVDASFEYQAVPKLSDKVYLIAKIHDWKKAELASGVAKLFMENSYVGESRLNTGQYQDTLQLSFGVDHNVIVKRERVENYSEKTIIGSNRRENASYKITVRNNKSYPINIVVYDQIPISKVGEISVDGVDVNGGKLNKESGKVEWNLNLNSNEMKVVTLKYTLKYPKDKQINHY